MIIVWECEINYRGFRDIKTPVFPRIMKPFESRTPKHISSLVLDESLFGFVECSLISPENVIQRFSSINFAPIISRKLVTEDMLTDFMKKRIAELNRKIPKEGLETVTNSFTVDRYLFFTPMLKLLLELGLIMIEVFDVIQYSKAKCFRPFIEKCVKGRIESDKAGQSVASQCYKTAMNSSYGKLAENVSKARLIIKYFNRFFQVNQKNSL